MLTGVPFLQTICAPVGPKCDQCELSDGLCPSARKVTKASSSKRKRTASAMLDAEADAGPRIEVKFEEEECKVAITAPTPTLPDADGALKVKKEES